jgi:hypothetical protein
MFRSPDESPSESPSDSTLCNVSRNVDSDAGFLSGIGIFDGGRAGFAPSSHSTQVGARVGGGVTILTVYTSTSTETSDLSKSLSSHSIQVGGAVGVRSPPLLPAGVGALPPLPLPSPVSASSSELSSSVDSSSELSSSVERRVKIKGPAHTKMTFTKIDSSSYR